MWSIGETDLSGDFPQIGLDFAQYNGETWYERATICAETVEEAKDLAEKLVTFLNSN